MKVWLVQIWKYENANEKEQTFSWRGKNVQKRPKNEYRDTVKIRPSGLYHRSRVFTSGNKRDNFLQNAKNSVRKKRQNACSQITSVFLARKFA